MTKGILTDIGLQQKILTYLELGRQPKWIINKLKISKSVFYRIRKKGQIQQRKVYTIKPGPRKRVSKKQILRLQIDLKKNPRTSLRKLRLKHKIGASNATLSRVLRSIGVERRKMKKRPKMTQDHMKKRVDFALRHCHPDFDWSKWIFTDEKKFNLDGPMVTTIIGIHLDLHHYISPKTPLRRNM
jgi:Transposase